MVALTTYDYEALASQLGVPVKTILAGLDSRKSLHGLYQDVRSIKTIFDTRAT
jgi:hypothetical protein